MNIHSMETKKDKKHNQIEMVVDERPVESPSHQNKSEPNNSPDHNPDDHKEPIIDDKEEQMLEQERLKKLLIGSGKSVSVVKLYCTMSSGIDYLLMTLGFLGAVGSGLSMPLFSYLLGSTLGDFGPTNTPEQIRSAIGKMIFQFLVIGAAMFVAQALNAGCWTWTGMRQLHKLKEEYFRIIMRQEQGWFDKNNAFEFSTKVQSQVKQIEGGMGDKLGNLISALSMFFVGIIIALITSWKLTLVLIACLPLMVIGVLIATTALKNGARISRKSYEKAGGVAEEILYSIKTVASFANFDFEINRYQSLINESKEAGVKNGLRSGLGIGMIFGVFFLVYSLAIWYGSTLIVSGDKSNQSGQPMRGGDVLTVLFSVVMAAVSLGAAGPNMKAITEACIAASDFFELRDRYPEIDESGDLKPEKEKVQGKIIFDHVEFAYPSKPDLRILKGISLTFESGQSTALVGESGSGKSTIVNLVERLYEPTGGNIYIDGILINQFDLKYLRSLIGYVQQEPVLFNDTIRNNVIFGRTDINDDMIWNALEQAYAVDFVREKGGLDYVVGIKGSKLSGGQKQRIAIARAILTKPKLLILDEATSALDNKSEKEVQRALERVSQNVTTIIIAHRLTTIRNADKIVAMRMGEVVETGTHDSLFAKDGYYATLVKSQTTEKEDDAKEEGEVLDEENNNNEPKRHKLQKYDSQTHLKTESVQLVENKQNSNDNNNNNNLHDEIHLDETKKQEAKGAKMMPQSRRRLLSMLSDKKCLLISGAVAAAFNGAVFPTYGILLAMAINGLSSPDPKVVADQGGFLALMFIVIAVSSGTSQFFQNYLFTAIGETLCAKLRNATFTKYLRMHMGFYDLPENSPGSLLTKLSSDTTQLNGVVLTMIGVSVQCIVNLGAGLTLGLVYDWRLSLIALGFMPFIILSGVLQEKLKRGLITGDDKLDVEAGSVLSESVINTKTIFSYNMQDKVITLFSNILEPSRAGIPKQCYITGFLYGLGQFANFATYATVFYAGGNWIIDGSLSFENMMRAIFSILFAAFGVSQALQYVGDFSKARVAIASLFTILESETLIDPFVDANADKISATNLSGRIEFRDVKFAYPTKSNITVLNGISFTIEPGQSAAFVGFSGSGKSTIVQLIERFYDVTDGQVLIDGVDVKKYNLYELRKKIGIVSQEPTLFKREVRENIRYGRLEASDSEVAKTADHANISYLFQGEDAGKKVSPMSGGEKQRVAIARLLIKDPRIVLLDEATSALDADTEKEVQKSIDLLMAGRTSISIAHRLSTIENSDVIFVVEAGRIVEQGNHRNLLDRKGKYYGLYKSQNN